VSAAMGRHAFASWGRRQLGLLKRVFTLKHLPQYILTPAIGLAPSAAGSTTLSLRHTIAQAQALCDLKKPTPVKIHNMARGEAEGVIRVNSASYGNHVRFGDVFFRILAPACEGGGRAEAEQVELAARVLGEPRGRLSELKLEPFDKVQLLSGIRSLPLRRAIEHIAKSPVANLISLWEADYELSGPAAAGAAAAAALSGGSQVRVRLFTSEEGDIDALTSLPKATVSRLIRSLAVDPGSWPPAVRAFDEPLQEMHTAAATSSSPSPPYAPFEAALRDIYKGGLRDMLHLLHRSPLTPCATLSAADEEELASHEELNEQQLAAARNAFSSRVSCVHGPPGTGKTRTIAAIADVAVARGRRMLVMAPANAASRRLLESVVSAGVEDVCLIVAQVSCLARASRGQVTLPPLGWKTLSPRFFFRRSTCLNGTRTRITGTSRTTSTRQR
jgi:hypothetical protein